MKPKNLPEKLSTLDPEAQDSESYSCEDLQVLLTKLEMKQNKLEDKLAETKNVGKRKKLKLEIKIIKAQLKKGKELADANCN